MRTIVSVTPIPVERDSRTFKIASFYSRLGYRSIVVEGQPSQNLSAVLPFELVSAGAVAADASPTPDSPSSAALGTPRDGATDGAAPLTGLDALAARTPPWLRAVLGPPWRRLRVGHLMQLVGSLRAYLEMCIETARALPPADLYHLHAQLQLPAVLWHTRRGGAPFIYDAHDLYATMRINAPPLPPAARAMWRIWDVLERQSARRATVCVTVSEGVAAHAAEEFGRSFAVVRNAHDERLDERMSIDIRSAAGVDASALVVAVVGNHKPEIIAIDPLIEALTRLPDHVHVVCIGRGYDGVVAAAEKLAVAQRVHVLAPVRPTQIVPFLRTADLVPILYVPLNADIRNALPNKFFQGVAAGVPILYGCHQADVRRLCRQHELGWEIDPENVASLVTTIARLDGDREALRRCGARVIAARHALSWAAEDAKLETLVKQSLNGKAP